MSYAAGALPVLGGIVGAIGSEEQGAAQSNAYHYQAQVLNNNATLANQKAALTMAAGEQQSAIAGMQTRAKVAHEKAAQAASGLDVNSGSPVDVREASSAIGAYDALTMRSNAARAAYGYQTEAVGLQSEAALANVGASQAQTAGHIGAVSSLLNGGSQGYSNYSSWQMNSGGGGGGGDLGGGGGANSAGGRGESTTALWG